MVFLRHCPRRRMNAAPLTLITYQAKPEVNDINQSRAPKARQEIRIRDNRVPWVTN